MADAHRDTSHIRVLAVIGPTATGKSDLAVGLAQRLGGEIINADSMQLYAGMDIGTAKLPLDERGGVPHHLLDVWPLAKSAAVAEYQTRARAAIADIHARGHLPILVGGSGLYLRGALDDLDFPGENAALRAGLYAALDEIGPEALHARLAEVDPVAAAAILPTNGRRIARALEVVELTGQPFMARMPGFESIFDTTQIGLDRSDLDDRVELRVQRMIELGLIGEIRTLLPLGLRESPTAGKALGYQQLLAVLDDAGEVAGDLDDAIAQTVRGTLRFVRRQRRWFRRDPRVRWLDAADTDLLDQALASVGSVL
ncbi:tRNA (adenosine(37)-N6)-dimethylallyltransferase MiaA [uncultured Jatrophihabitans sp.]|uniref:tRNA (adenosine(37)-N6)-dimethylallyltransferase MiaA n=1 Tax=uncultured Jatrophihabitans sp. TaxID=1610747 RepID=UPI0035C9A023